MARISKLVHEGDTVGYRTNFGGVLYDVDTHTLNALGMAIVDNAREIELIDHNGALRSSSEIKHGQRVVDISGNLKKAKQVFSPYDIMSGE